MLDTNEQLKHISDKEIRQLVLQTIIDYETENITKYLCQHKRMKKIIMSFSDYKNDGLKFCLDNKGYKVAKYELDNPHNANATNDDAKQLIKQYVAKLTNFDLIDLHCQLENTSSCTYNTLKHNLTRWIISNYVNLSKKFTLDALAIDHYSDDLVEYMLVKYANNWDIFDEYELNLISEILAEIPLKNHVLSCTILDQINIAFLNIKDSNPRNYNHFIDAAIKNNKTISVPISALKYLNSKAYKLRPAKLPKMTLITRNKKDVIKLMDFLLSKNNITAEEPENVQLLKEAGCQFETGKFKDLYYNCFVSLSNYPFYKQMDNMNQAVNALQIMFPNICK